MRTATTFGPSFAERALTAGEGKVTVGANFTYSNFDRLDDRTLEQLAGRSPVDAAGRRPPTRADDARHQSRKRCVFSGALGVTDNLDIGVAVPLVTVEVDGISSFQDGTGVGASSTKGGGIVHGHRRHRRPGEISGFVHFGARPARPRRRRRDRATCACRPATRQLSRPRRHPHDPVGLFSSGKGRFRPHGNAGFEFWSKGVDAVTNFTPHEHGDRPQPVSIRRRHRSSKPRRSSRVMADLIGRHILGAGQSRIPEHAGDASSSYRGGRDVVRLDGHAARRHPEAEPGAGPES